MRIDRRAAAAILALPVLFLVAFFAVPFAVVVLDSLRTGDAGWGVGQYAKLFEGWFYADAVMYGNGQGAGAPLERASNSWCGRLGPEARR